MAESLRSLAQELAIPERTLRRAAGEGLLRGRRVSAHRFETTVRERAYLRDWWGRLSELRSALRTEPNVRLAVLFGSSARGDAGPDSDVDVMVALADDDRVRVYDLQERLERRLGRAVDVVRRADAERSVWLLAEIVTDGRVLVDRDGRWPALQRRRAALVKRAEAELDALTAEALEHSAVL